MSWPCIKEKYDYGVCFWKLGLDHGRFFRTIFIFLETFISLS